MNSGPNKNPSQGSLLKEKPNNISAAFDDSVEKKPPAEPNSAADSSFTENGSGSAKQTALSRPKGFLLPDFKRVAGSTREEPEN